MSDKMQKDGNDDILEYLSAQMGCTYLSDLRRSDIDKECVLKTLDHIPEGCYSLRAWHDVVAYFECDNGTPMNEQQARAQLRDLLAD